MTSSDTHSRVTVTPPGLHSSNLSAMYGPDVSVLVPAEHLSLTVSTLTCVIFDVLRYFSLFAIIVGYSYIPTKRVYGHFHVRVASEENSELAPGDF